MTSISGASRMSMFPEVDALKARLDRFRPVPEAIKPHLQQNLIEEWTYHSLDLDGFELDLAGVRLLLRHRRTPAGASFDDLIRIANHAEAARYCLDLATNKDGRRTLTESILQKIHGLSISGELQLAPYRTLLAEDLWNQGNDFQLPHPAGTERSGFPLPDPLDIPGGLDLLFQNDAKELEHRHAIESAAALFGGLIELQPFAEGNGPTARLLLSLRLAFLGYPALSFATWNREDSAEAGEASRRGDLYPLIELIERELLRSARLELHALEDRRSLTPERIGIRFQRLDQHLDVVEDTGPTPTTQSPISRARAVRRVGGQILGLLTRVRKHAHGERYSVRENGSYRQGLESDLMANVFRNLVKNGLSPQSPQWHHESVLEFRPIQASIIEADLFFCTFASTENLHVVVVASILKETSPILDEIGEELDNAQPDPSRIEVLLHDDILTLPLTYPFQKEKPVAPDLENFVLDASDLFLDRILESYLTAARSPATESEPKAKTKTQGKTEDFRPLAPARTTKKA